MLCLTDGYSLVKTIQSYWRAMRENESYWLNHIDQNEPYLSISNDIVSYWIIQCCFCYRDGWNSVNRNQWTQFLFLVFLKLIQNFHKIYSWPCKKNQDSWATLTMTLEDTSFTRKVERLLNNSGTLFFFESSFWTSKLSRAATVL